MRGPDADTVRHELSGQICRCTGYANIVKAIVAAGQDRAVATSENSRAFRDAEARPESSRRDFS